MIDLWLPFINLIDYLLPIPDMSIGDKLILTSLLFGIGVFILGKVVKK